MQFVYILHSQTKNKYYVGHAQDIEARMKKHNARQVPSTKYGVPWKVVYTEQCVSKHEAYRREFEIKSYKGGEAFKKLLAR